MDALQKSGGTTPPSANESNTETAIRHNPVSRSRRCRTLSDCRLAGSEQIYVTAGFLGIDGHVSRISLNRKRVAKVAILSTSSFLDMI